MTVAYDGAGFHGFAVQPGQRTVGGVLQAAIGKVLGHGIALTCAGRTDAGVHAWGQVVSFDAESGRLEPARLADSVNTMLSPAVVVRSVEVCPGFDARRVAIARLYRYTVLNRPVPDPFLAATSWHVADPLDLRALRIACDPLIGEHDFSSFCRVLRARPDASLVRVVRDAGWRDCGEGVLRFDIEASSFCHQMVRSLVGLMIDMGRGRRKAGEMSGVLRATSRRAAGANLAPPHGLCLWEVRYPQPSFSGRPAGVALPEIG